MYKQRHWFGRKVFTIALFSFVAIAVAGGIGFRVAASVQADPSSEITMPPEYRHWRLISVAHEGGKLSDLRAVLGNDLAIHAYRSGTLPFPDGTIIARLAWVYTPSKENDEAFGDNQSFVAGKATNVQLMVKDSKKHASTGGWGFAQFTNGNPANEAKTEACFSCHVPAKANDYVFTHYAP